MIAITYARKLFSWERIFFAIIYFSSVLKCSTDHPRGKHSNLYNSTKSAGNISHLTKRKWFSVVCTLIDNDIRHHSGENVVDSHSAQQVLTTVMTNIVVNKITDNAEPLSIYFLPQYSTPKKVFISERDQNHNTKKSKRCL